MADDTSAGGQDVNERATQQFWKIAPGENARYWEECRVGGFISIGWNELGDLSGTSRKEFNQRRDKLLREHPDYRSKPGANPNALGVNQVWRFKNINDGDRIVANQGTKLVVGIGTVSGPYYFAETGEQRHRLPVTWHDIRCRAVEELGFVSALKPLDAAKFKRIVGSPIVECPERPPNPRPPDDPRPPKEHPPTLDDLVGETYLTREELQDLESLLEEKRHVILEGPPGAGKTYVGELFARYFTENPLHDDPDDRLTLVQFHQTYSYEDFVQGIRPETNVNGQLEYHVRDGIFKRLCAVAERNPPKKFVIVIDEINRGNISRIFGELLLLLEYRDKSARLPYGKPDDPPFSIPPNVYLIGTMNTVDRSLAQIDYALRRRFYFYQMQPVVDGAAPVLERWLERQDNIAIDDRARVVHLFLGLNARVQQALGEGFQVGHSYFMTPDIGTAKGQRRVWRRAILPLLDEYFYNRRNRAELLADFAIERLLGGDPADAAQLAPT